LSGGHKPPLILSPDYPMNAPRPETRRNVVRGLAATAAALTLAPPVFAQAAARIVVIGGGFGGASCARALKRLDPKLQVTLIEPNNIFTACPFSNEVIAGLRELEAQQFTYDKIAAEGITVIAQAAARIDPKTRTVGLADGTSLSYDRLVLAPGIDLRFDALPGYDEAASAKMPHAWKAGEQTALLRRQLEAMDDGGTVVLAVPASPSRCPPAPYERASLIAHYLKAKKPRSKVLILDAKDAFPQQRLFENAWKELYPDMIERIALSQGGRVVSVDPATNTIVTDFGNYPAKVANVIPPQKAGHIAEIAGAADHTGWCPIDPLTLASKLVPDTHVIGDACLGGGIPKSASAASAQGKACAAIIAAQIAGKTPAPPVLEGVCFSKIAPDYALSQGGVYQPKGDTFVQEWAFGAFDNWDELPSEAKAAAAKTWFQTITADAFG
jgi:sulfide dehydrogenase [flavocytochrome c] flavoprotein chain